mgnify:CR=1 FL=1
MTSFKAWLFAELRRPRARHAKPNRMMKQARGLVKSEDCPERDIDSLRRLRDRGWLSTSTVTFSPTLWTFYFDILFVDKLGYIKKYSVRIYLVVRNYLKLIWLVYGAATSKWIMSLLLILFTISRLKLVVLKAIPHWLNILLTVSRLKFAVSIKAISHWFNFQAIKNIMHH